MAEHWIFLSPHFDDVALSLGGAVWEQAQKGARVEIWTLCAGGLAPDKPLTDFARSLHEIWKLGDDVPRLRASEDEAACQRLGATWHHFPIPDCIYRFHSKNGKPFVQTEEDLFKNYTGEEFDTFLAAVSAVPLPANANIAVPLGVGNHRDHWLTRTVAERLFSEVWHYIDYPYVVQEDFNKEMYIPMLADSWKCAISPSGLLAWQEAIACHHSQIALFWESDQEMYAAIQTYRQRMQDVFHDTYLWKF